MKNDTERDKEKEAAEPEKCVVIDRRPNYDADVRDDAGAASGPVEPRYPSFVEELKARAETAEQRAREISAAYRRIEEERDAFRERLARDLERRVDVARAELLRKMLGIADDLERAVSVATEMAESSPMLDGVILIRDRLLQALASEGVETISTIGKPFDPTNAEAMAVEAVTDPARDSVVLEELQRGYLLRGTLLQPARVRVARLERPAEEAPPDTIPTDREKPPLET